jgi:predicted enzyme related to lactoylglutathione lyase
MSITHLFAGIPVSDYDASLEWYERLFARPPDRAPNENESVWQVAETGLIYVVRDAQRAGNALVTLIVDDLDQRLDGLAERGITTDGIVELPGVARKAAFTDPEGNTIAFAELQAQT